MEEFKLELCGLSDEVLIDLFLTLEKEIELAENEDHKQAALLDYCCCICEIKKRKITTSEIRTLH